MKRFLAIFAVLMFTAVSLAATAAPKLDGVKCPLSGKPVVADKTVDYKGGKVFFCCANCPKAFDAKKHANKGNHQLVQTGQYKQVKCFLAGRPVDATKTVVAAGVKVGVCCGGCLGKLKAAEDKVAFAFNDAAFAKGFAAVKAKK
jgi:YHS domain-containing protein